MSASHPNRRWSGFITSAIAALFLALPSGLPAQSSPLTVQPSTGRVGVGTTAPNSKIEAKGTDVGVSVMNNAGTQNYYIGIKDSDSNKFYLGRGKDPSQGITPAITVDTTDKVGIGNASPLEKLDVVGNVKATAFIGNGSQLTNLPGGGGNSALDKVTADTTVSSTAAETSLYSFSVPANTLGTNNRLRLVIQGEYRSTVCTDCQASFVFRLKYGGITLFATPAFFPPTTLSPFVAEMLLSADGTARSQLGSLWGAHGPAGVDSTAAQTLQITVDWDVAMRTISYGSSMRFWSSLSN